MRKFTFKKYPRPTGLASVGFKRGADIKLNKRECGFYQEREWGKFSVFFAVKSCYGKSNEVARVK